MYRRSPYFLCVLREVPGGRRGGSESGVLAVPLELTRGGGREHPGTGSPSRKGVAGAWRTSVGGQVVLTQVRVSLRKSVLSGGWCFQGESLL